MQIDSTKNKIINVAHKLFGRFGFHKTSMDEIAKITRKAKGSLYYHFKSKEELFREVVSKEICQLKAQLSPIIIDPDITAAEKILNPVPVNRVARQENDILIAVNINSIIPPSTHTPPDPQPKIFNKLRRFQRRITRLFPPNNKESVGYFHLISDTTSLMLSQITKLTLAICPPDILIEISRQSYGTFDFYKAKELIALGEEVTRKKLS